MASEDEELALFYKTLFASELTHYKVFLKLAYKIAPKAKVEARWPHMLAAEAEIIARQPVGPRIHSGVG